MENEINDKKDLIEKISIILNEKKKILIIILAIIIIILTSLFILNYYQNIKNEKISERFIEAGIYLSSENRKKSAEIYKEIIYKKNKFYSVLSLNYIIDNELEENSEEIIKLFDVIESIKVSKEEKNLIKFKKALYLKKISKQEEGNKLLKEIISENSIWKDAASEITK